MKKSIKVMPKKRRGRPATGKDPQVIARMPAALIASIDKWAAERDINRSEAIRLLLEGPFKSLKAGLENLAHPPPVRYS
jgi:hypothetical protein